MSCVAHEADNLAGPDLSEVIGLKGLFSEDLELRREYFWPQRYCSRAKATQRPDTPAEGQNFGKQTEQLDYHDILILIASSASVPAVFCSAV